MKTKDRKTLAVLLTVHNRCPQTVKCLKALYVQELLGGVQLDVYMVDDGCTDGTSETISEQFPDVNIIRGDGSLFWNRGMWTAWDVAIKNKIYDYFLWLNDDTFLVKDAIAQLIDTCDNYNNEVIVVGATEASNCNILTYGGHISTGIPQCNGTPIEVNGFNGNIVLIPNAVYSILGNLDYYYRHSKGDYDYALRARKAGIKMYQCGTILGVCDEHEHMDVWCNPEIPFGIRWKRLHQPTGMPPRETFHYEKQINVFMAVFHYVSVYVRCIFPRVWVNKMDKQV